MSLFGTIITEAEDIGKYLHHNTKDVGHTATAIGTAAKSEGEKTLPDVVQKIDKAGADLKDKVDRDPDLQKPKATSSGPYDLVGLWPEPPSGQTPTVPPSFGSDIAKFLRANQLPTTVGKGKDTTDVGEAIAQQIFGPVGENTIKNDEKYLKKTFEVKDEETGYNLKGGHIFYKVPLGKNGVEEGWHSYLRAWEV